MMMTGWSCSNGGGDQVSPPPPPPSTFSFTDLTVNGSLKGFTHYGVNTTPSLKMSFSDKVDRNTVATATTFSTKSGTAVPVTVTYENGDSAIIIRPAAALSYLTAYQVTVGGSLKSSSSKVLQAPVSLALTTEIDAKDKFPQVSDEELLTLVQKRTFRYFWDLAHPVSGLALERNTSGETVTSGGSGFGIMAIIVGVERGFITRTEGQARMQKITNFLRNAERFHGAFPHWLNGTTGKAIPFGEKDNGADLVETAYLVQGLLAARQYFKGTDVTETAIRDNINAICSAVEWNWFRKNNENVLYWHWSPNYNWDMNMPIKGWSECLITYILAAANGPYTVPAAVYTSGWARNGAMKNNNDYFGLKLPLGPAFGGPLFFSHYSFLGVNPNGLTDQYADYKTQVVNHAKINYAHCVANPSGFYGYGPNCWGLTASDIPNGYAASSPTNDIGVIAPTAALASFPYTPDASMSALKFFYYKLGDRIWKDYGFTDAFSLKDVWFADSHIAIDQGPIIIMIENYRSGLLWNLLMSSPEIKSGLHNLGFVSPYI
ncbi:MAG TPA: glucoamylase family protein [Chitinophaga sp.]|uniref:glucoamylase family protein n=1 Tax=Chitinophaga sp. TaxID=1869181 RepID=UPI002C470D34|nr:glucoamylase family protein [Chitinophaga sp.]HVI49518.1 glucoamylase family protein [Chitinophaga sp.]